MPQKRVGLLFGTFDFLHSGHLFLLKEAKKGVDHLVVVVSSDQSVKRYKGRSPYFKDQERQKSVLAVEEVDEAFIEDPEEEEGSFSIFEQVFPQVVYLGHDQESLHQAILHWGQNQGRDQTQSRDRDINQSLPFEIIILPPFHRDSFRSGLYRERQEEKDRVRLENNSKNV